MQARLLFAVIGLIIGGAIGWLTAPAPTASIAVGDVKVEVQQGTEGGSMMATTPKGNGVEVKVGDGGGPFNDRTTRTLIFAVIGGVIGLVVAGVAGRTRRV